MVSFQGSETPVLKLKAEVIMQDHPDCLNRPGKYITVTAKESLLWSMISISVFYVSRVYSEDCAWNDSRSLVFFLVRSYSTQYSSFLKPAVIHPPRWREAG